ncbi:Bacterial-like globin [Hoeflea sp. IMCC20628]|nr:Bacterial-like globin [Hoeflea sp. IMCC20628]
MNQYNYPTYPTRHGYMSEKIQQDYILSAISRKVLPRDAHRMAHIISLDASNDVARPIQIWQLYSVLGPERIVAIVTDFYGRVFADEDWFTSVFARVGPVEHHIHTQSAMWIDVMGGGPAYHGGDFRLNFHHTHNAIQLMNEKGAARWTRLMLDTLEATAPHMTNDPRVRPALNTFLTHFMGKYAQEFGFENKSVFGNTNAPVKRKLNFMNMTTQAIEALSETELRDALAERGVDVSQYPGKQDLVNKAQML